MYCVALPWVLVGNGAKMRLEIIMIFFIVEYAFILLEGLEDFLSQTCLVNLGLGSPA